METAQHPLIHLLGSLGLLCSAQMREKTTNYTLWSFGSGHVNDVASDVPQHHQDT
jgi:hypothetical protein